MLKRLVFLVAVFALTPSASAVWAAGVGPQFLVRLNLDKPADFQRAEALDLKPVYRWGNEFYIVIDGAGLLELDGARLMYRVVETDPFTTGHYYIDGRVPLLETVGPAKSEARPLDQVGDATVWKTDRPLMLKERFAGEAPYEITPATIPLTYIKPLTVGVTTLDSPILDTIVARVNQDSVIAFDTRLRNFNTRYFYTDSNRAAQTWLKQKFLSFGYTDVKDDTFNISGWDAHNIICTKPGDTEPDKVIIVGAHFDSYNTQSDPLVFAPGADDNGSGTSAVLEIARALAQIPTRKTIIFVLFNAEELGLMGSDYFAGRAAAEGMNIELMINMDMIGYNPDAVNNVLVYTNPASVAYADIAAELAGTKTSLIPTVNMSPSGNSDHASFSDRGYHIVYASEGDFNFGSWHTDIDLISRLNPAYWTDVVRMVAMTAYVASKAPSPVESVELWDVGDGQSLEVRWAAAASPDIVAYKVYRGLSSGVYTDTITVSAGVLTTTLTGLVEGNEYYVTVTAVAADGWESIARTEMSLTPYSVPRAPTGVVADVELARMELAWNNSVELDFDHYSIYRGTDSTSLSVYIPFLVANTYTDYGVSGGTRYFYQVVAVDQSGNPSAPSAIVSGIPATFDQDILVFDLTAHTAGDPTEAEQWTVYNAMFAPYQHGYYKYDDYATPIDKSELGQYRTVFWIDDDQLWDSWPADHWAKLNWYLSYGNNLVICGWMTAQEMASSSGLYDLFRISDVNRVTPVDCVGGIGEAGFPSVVFDTAKVYPTWNGVFGYIYTMTPADASAEVVLRYNSATDDPAREALTVGIRRNTGTNKLGLISLPLYYLREADATALVTAFADWFGQAPAAAGDINGDGTIDVVDISYLIDVVFNGMQPFTGYTRADVNADCQVDVVDIVYLVDYVLRGGAAPLDGCVQ